MGRGARWVAYWLVIALSIGFAGYVVWDQRRENARLGAQVRSDPLPAVADSPTPSPTPARRPVVLFVGDGYLLGSRSFGRRTCTQLDWTCRYDAVAGSGYRTGTTYASRLPALARYRPDLVVVSGGRSDLGRYHLEATARAYLDGLSSRFPKAKVVVLEPFWNDDVSYQMITDVRAAIRAAAERSGATWVQTEGWLSGSANFRGGGALLSATGNQMLTTRLVTRLPPVLAAG